MIITKAEAARILGLHREVFYMPSAKTKWGECFTEDGMVDLEKARKIQRFYDKEKPETVWKAKEKMEELKQRYRAAYLAKVLGCSETTISLCSFGYPLARKILDIFGEPILTKECK